MNGAHSTWAFLEAIVPQGSILGSLLFLVYVNDITDGIKSDINLFADDASLLEIDDDPTTSANTPNSDLEQLHQWASWWLVTFNPNKILILTLFAKINKPIHPTMYLSGTPPLEEVLYHTHLGITFSHDLSWTHHIKSVLKKASQSISEKAEVYFK